MMRTSARMVLTLAVSLTLAFGGLFVNTNSANAATSAPGTARVTGVVFLYPSTVPAVGSVQVTLSPVVNGVVGPAGPSALTSTSGVFEINDIPLGAYKIRISSVVPGQLVDNYSWGALPQFSAAAAPTLQLTQPATETYYFLGQIPMHTLRTFGGSVLMPDGTPVAAGAATVSLYEGAPGVLTSSVPVGPGGSFSFSNLVPDLYQLKIDYHDSSILQETYPDLTQPLLDMRYSTVPAATITLHHAYVVSGRVALGTLGHSAAGADVRIFYRGTGVQVDANGNFRIAGLAAGPLSLDIEYFPQGRYSTVLADVTLSGNADVTGLVYVLPTPTSIVGQVRNQQGSGLSGIAVSAYRVDPNTGEYGPETPTTTTDSSGGYVLLTPVPGSYQLYFDDPSGSYASITYNQHSDVDIPDLVNVAQGQQVVGIDAVLPAPGYVYGVVGGASLTTDDFTSGRVTTEVQVLNRFTGQWGSYVRAQSVASDGSYGYALAPGSYRMDAKYVGPRGSFEVSSRTINLVSSTFARVNMTFSPSMADFSGDGFPDVLARDSVGSLYRYSGNGAGGWLGATRIGTGWNGFDRVFRVGDFDGDGCSDVVGRTSGGDLYLYRGDCGGGWLGASKIGVGWGAFTEIFGVGDFDNDTFPDVMARTPSGDLYLYRGDGAGGWAGSRRIGTGWNGFTTVFGVGDFSGDGKPDVMARTPSGDLYLYRGNGSGGWLGSSRIGTGWGIFTAIIGAGDFSGDGFPDVLARTPGGDLYLYEGNGLGGWKHSSRIGTGWGPLGLVS